MISEKTKQELEIVKVDFFPKWKGKNPFEIIEAYEKFIILCNQFELSCAENEISPYLNPEANLVLFIKSLITKWLNEYEEDLEKFASEGILDKYPFGKLFGSKNILSLAIDFVFCFERVVKSLTKDNRIETIL
jgi:hypothetical protein